MTKLGQDRAYIDKLGQGLFRFLHDRWWRHEWRGLESVPRQGRGVLVGVHRGFQPWDGVMILHLLARELGRYPRFLIHPSLLQPRSLGRFMTRLGGVVASQPNARQILEDDSLLGIFPEGIRGAFTLYRDAYHLGPFGRDHFVKIALRHRAPVVPFVTVGSAEIFPILGAIRSRRFRRWAGWPFFPLTPTLGLVPLPSKWHTRFLEPRHWELEYPPEAADDPKLVRRLGAEVRGHMQQTLTSMHRQRPGIFHGSLFERPSSVALAADGTP